jgi:ATP-dependent helicase HepA
LNTSARQSPGWREGDYLTHRFNPELGIGRITALEGRALVVEFPRSGARLRLAANTDVLVAVNLDPGRPVRVTATRQETTVKGRRPDGTLELANGDVAPPHALWPLDLDGALLERLAVGDLDDAKDFLTRLDVLRLLTIREAGGLGTFLGGRVRLFPHQLYVAERASAADPVRWLLADEVGLGKTIEAGLVLRSLILNGELQRILIVAPRNLVRQWMEELREKFALTAWFYDGHMLHDVGGRVRRSEDPWAEDGIARRRSSTVPRTCRRVWKR